MRDPNHSDSEFELLPQDLDTVHAKESKCGHLDPATKTSPYGWISWRLPGIKHILIALPLFVAIIPLVLLLAYSSHLSNQLGSNGCTPSGEFVLPKTTSVWDLKNFFVITIAFLGPDYTSCSPGGYSANSDLACTGYSFTKVKVIDIAWDILVGRGCQVASIAIAYRIFGRVIKVLMQQGEVGYDLFTAVAFDAGSGSSFLTILRHAIGYTPIPRTKRATVMYVGMGVATLWIIIMPSLLAAMTGYTSYYAPMLNTEADVAGAASGLKDCDGTISPVWGKIEPIPYSGNTWGFYSVTPTLGNYYAQIYDDYEYSLYYAWLDYYARYSDVYDVCPKQLNISTCKQAQQDTYMHILEPEPIKIFSPMPGILPYPNSTTAASTYTHWQCSDIVFPASELQQASNSDSPTKFSGVCRAGNGYAWGFSFLLLFITCILNLLFVLLMYALWLHTTRTGTATSDVGVFKDAVMMATMAQQQYGGRIGEWSASALQKEIIGGQAGMSFVNDKMLSRRRKVAPVKDDERELGDPRGGDGGGDVVLLDRQ